jgi:hypothetical protein
MKKTLVSLVLILSLFGLVTAVFASEDSGVWLAKGKSKRNAGNYVEAFQCFKISAEAGEAEAEYDLGYCYLTGQGVDRDEAEAFKWFQKSADQGNPQGQFGVGYCYENGWGVNADVESAKAKYQLASKQGFAGAKAALDRLTAIPTPITGLTVGAPNVSVLHDNYESVEPALSADSPTVAGSGSASEPPMPDAGAPPMPDAGTPPLPSNAPALPGDKSAPAPDSAQVDVPALPADNGPGGAPPLPSGK